MSRILTLWGPWSRSTEVCLPANAANSLGSWVFASDFFELTLVSLVSGLAGRMVRELDDKYGRNITKVRHALTDSDRQPLPTVSKGGGGGGGGSGDDQAQGQQDGAAEQQQQLVAEAAAGQLVVEEDKEEMPAAAAVVPGEKGAGGGAGEWSPRGEAVASEQTV